MPYKSSEDPVSLPLDSLGQWIGIKDQLADLSGPICNCWVFLCISFWPPDDHSDTFWWLCHILMTPFILAELIYALWAVYSNFILIWYIVHFDNNFPQHIRELSSLWEMEEGFSGRGLFALWIARHFSYWSSKRYDMTDHSGLAAWTISSALKCLLSLNCRQELS